MSQTQPPSQPGVREEPGSPGALRRQLHELDKDNAAAWRRCDELEWECAQWKECAQRERETLAEMEKSVSWFLTAPLREIWRIQLRLRRSAGKRFAKAGAFFRRLIGKNEPAPAAEESASQPSTSHYRDAMMRAAESPTKNFLKGPRIAPPQTARDRAVPEFAVYFNASGNYFFQEIAHLLNAALREAGFRSELRTDEHGASARAEFHLIVAPHEFFPLGRGASCFHRSMKDRLFLLNTEQPQTRWFQLGRSVFPHVRHIFDMDRETAGIIAASGFPASHLPLGFVENFAPYAADRDLCLGPETEALPPEVRRWRDDGRPLAERPIALSFVGEATPRRSAFFAKIAPMIERHESHLRLMPGGAPPWLAGGARIHKRTLTTVGISQRSRIVLNIHRDREHYFEWHRIVLMGIWQRALVLTETVSETSPFVAGRDYVQASIEDMPRLIEYHLRDPQGIAEAERIRDSAHAQLRTQCNLPALMRQVWAPFLAEVK